MGAEDSLAWIFVSAHPFETVKKISNAVFEEHGYESARSTANEFVYEKVGSLTRRLLYGDFDRPVTQRITLRLSRQKDGGLLLHCNAWTVRNAGDKILEDTQKSWRSGECDELLAEIKKRLDIL